MGGIPFSPMNTPEAPAPARRARITETLAVVILLVVYWLMAYQGLRATTLTADEGFHLVSGYAYWTEQDFRYQSENGNLPQRMGAVPLLFFKEKPLLPETPARVNGNHFDLATQFLWQSGNHPEALLLAGRVFMLSVAGLGLCLAVYLCARRRWGPLGGLLSLTLACFSPDLLAHGGLITSDVSFALCMLLSLVCVWDMLHRVHWGRVLLTGLVLGLTAVAKFSAPLVGVMALLMWAAVLVRKPEMTLALGRRVHPLTSRGKAFLWQALAFALAGFVAWIVLWGFYDFRFSGAPAGSAHVEYSNKKNDLLLQCLAAKKPELVQSLRTQADVDSALKNIGGLLGVLQTVEQWRLLPEAYLHGFLHTYAFSQQRSAFLLGERSNTGWRSYFLVTFGIKTPLALFALIAAALVVGVARVRAAPGPRLRAWGLALYPLTPYFAGILVYGGMAVLTNLNIGHRHILPIYPLIYILLGGVSTLWIRKGWWGKALLSALLLWYALSPLGVRPHFLAYFNPLLGGPAQGYRALIDSSLDWGQDVPAVVKTVEKLRAEGDKEPVYYALFGSGWPEFYGLQARHLPAYRITGAVVSLAVPPLEPGLYLIHATQLQNVYVEAPAQWTPEIERMFGQMALLIQSWQSRAHTAQELASLLATQNPYGLEFAPEATPEQIRGALLQRNVQLLVQYNNLRFIKLCAWLRAREPLFQINYTVNAYRLTQKDLDEALPLPQVGLPEPLTDTLAQMLGFPTTTTRYHK